MSVNLSDTSRCPVASECEGCRRRVARRVYIADTTVGVLCVTLCRQCVGDNDSKRYAFGYGTVSGAVNSVLEHCEHLGISADDLVIAVKAELDAERGRERVV